MRKKQTKIVATISDRRCDPEFLRAMRDGGVDVMRLNTAHQSPEDTLKVISNIRKVSDRIGILIDTKGPEVRTTKTEDDLVYKKGETLKMKGTNKKDISTKDLVFVNYDGFVKDMPVGASIFIDDAKMELKVVKKAKEALVCEVMNDGLIKSNKSVNVPGVHIDLPTLNEKDKQYIDFSIKHGIDFIAHSFVRSKEDVIAIQKILDKRKSKIKIIAKIENQEGVENLDEILDHAHGVMVARGDLGVEMAAEEIPLIQKEMVKKCLLRRKPVIVATQMLQSMVKNPRPTRAEVSDVANAVFDGADAVMLSEESAGGDYPLEAVHIMAKIVRKVESKTETREYAPLLKGENIVASYLAKAAVKASRELDVKEIIISSMGSFPASVIASYRGRTPVFVKCFDKATAREMSLTYGVNAHYVEKNDDHKKFMKNLLGTLVKKGKLETSDTIIYLAGDSNEEGLANFMEICEVGKYASNPKANKKKGK